jgi:UDP-2,3-diacylglucosamine pyrophosphatase LpxH
VEYLLSRHDGLVFGNVEIHREAIHETADGRPLLVLHGDAFDSVIEAMPLLEALGNRAYAFVLKLNRCVNFLRRACNDGDWVESCTTLTEDFEGRLSLLRWTEVRR